MALTSSLAFLLSRDGREKRREQNSSGWRAVASIREKAGSRASPENQLEV